MFCLFFFCQICLYFKICYSNLCLRNLCIKPVSGNWDFAPLDNSLLSTKATVCLN